MSKILEFINENVFGIPHVYGHCKSCYRPIYSNSMVEHINKDLGGLCNSCYCLKKNTQIQMIHSLFKGYRNRSLADKKVRDKKGYAVFWIYNPSSCYFIIPKKLNKILVD